MVFLEPERPVEFPVNGQVSAAEDLTCDHYRFSNHGRPSHIGRKMTGRRSGRHRSAVLDRVCRSRRHRARLRGILFFFTVIPHYESLHPLVIRMKLWYYVNRLFAFWVVPA